VRRQQEQDLVALVGNMAQRLSEPQLQLLFLFASIIVRHKPGGLVPLVDADVAEAASAAAGTLEAASRGLIAELTASSRVADGLRRELMAFVSEVGKGGGSLFEREAAEVLRGIERGARHEGPGPRGDGWPADTAYLSLLSRVLPPASRDREEERSSIVLP
jgi:hypothetical protein